MMKAWTDYPFTNLGDKPNEVAPVREIEVLSYDGDKYCRVKFAGGVEEEIKSGYIYQREGRCGEVPHITRRQLEMLANAPHEGPARASCAGPLDAVVGRQRTGGNDGNLG